MAEVNSAICKEVAHAGEVSEGKDIPAWAWTDLT